MPKMKIAGWLTAALVFACTPADAPVRTAEVRDSAGVEVVENWTDPSVEDGFWFLDPDPGLDIGADGGESGPFLFQVVGAFQVESTREIVIANKGTSQVFVFDSSGTFRRAIGGAGQGPGELEGLNGLHRCGDGRFMVHEGRRASLFTANGEFLDVTPAEWRDIFNFEGVSSDCSSFLFLESQPPDNLQEGLVGSWSGTLSWGDLATHERTPLVAIPSFDMVGRTMGGVLQWAAYPWWRRSRWVVSGNRVILSTAENTDFQVWDMDSGLVKLVRWQGGRPPVTPADRNQNELVRGRGLARNVDLARLMPRLGETYVPELKPALWEILLDDEANVWVQEYPFWYGGWGVGWENRFGADPVRWTVFSPFGRMLGSVEVPAEIELLAIHRYHVVALWKDELQVEHVRLYRLNKG